MDTCSLHFDQGILTRIRDLHIEHIVLLFCLSILSLQLFTHKNSLGLIFSVGFFFYVKNWSTKYHGFRCKIYNLQLNTLKT